MLLQRYLHAICLSVIKYLFLPETIVLRTLIRLWDFSNLSMTGYCPCGSTRDLSPN